MKLTERQTDQAIEKGLLYGATFQGLQEGARKDKRSGEIDRYFKYMWRDEITGSNFLSDGLRDLADKIREHRKRFMNPKVNRETKKALKLSRGFYGFDPRKVRRINIDWPRSVVCLGPAAQVDYISDKFDGVVRRYFHEFKDAILYASAEPQKDGSNLLIIHGKFKVKPEGITG